MAVTAKLVKELRDKTGAGMMDCKKALTENNGDMEAAVDWLRKKGIASASKKSGRIAAEGRVMADTTATRGVLLEVNTETDFAAKNEKFTAFANNTLALALENGPADIDALLALTYPETGRTLADEVPNQIATIGENMAVRRVEVLNIEKGAVVTYIHMGGKIGSMVALESDGDTAALEELGKKVAMHVAAANPSYLDRTAVPAADLEREKAVLTEQAKSSGKPDNIIEKMVMGRINKFYNENCLVDQAFVMDQDTSVSKAVAAAAKSIGSPVKIVAFSRLALGEGIEKKQENFADEVNAQINQG
ncbi:MAG: elongation factor Ts [Magnetococcales bacterium]|nr:elongation factor Ts [Magnetococcales bacterium]